MERQTCDQEVVDSISGQVAAAYEDSGQVVHTHVSRRRQSSLLYTHTHPFNGPLSGIIRVSRYQKGKTNLDFTEARDSEW